MSSMASISSRRLAAGNAVKKRAPSVVLVKSVSAEISDSTLAARGSALFARATESGNRRQIGLGFGLLLLRHASQDGCSSIATPSPEYVSSGTSFATRVKPRHRSPRSRAGSACPGKRAHRTTDTPRARLRRAPRREAWVPMTRTSPSRAHRDTSALPTRSRPRAWLRPQVEAGWGSALAPGPPALRSQREVRRWLRAEPGPYPAISDKPSPRRLERLPTHLPSHASSA